MAYVYCVEYSDGSYYIGRTGNINKRMGDHGRGRTYFILEETDHKTSLLLEAMWIQTFKTWNLRLKNSAVWKMGGRKKIPKHDRKMFFGVYVKNSEIDLIGGKDEGREILLTAWKAAVKKKKK